MENQNELYHYGVKGQKWGVINEKLKEKKEQITGSKSYEKGATFAKRFLLANGALALSPLMPGLFTTGAAAVATKAAANTKAGKKVIRHIPKGKKFAKKIGLLD